MNQKKWTAILLSILFCAFVMGFGTKQEATVTLGLWAIACIFYVTDTDTEPIKIVVPKFPRHKTVKCNKKRSKKSYPADMWG